MAKIWKHSWLILLAACSLTRSSTTSLGGTGAPGGARTGTTSNASSASSSDDGSARATVPNLIGKTRDEANALVQAAGFASAPESTRPVECEDAPREPGRINCQDPEAGKVIARYGMITINVYEPVVIHGAIVRSQLETLRGMTPDQAKAQLKKLGHDGEVKLGVVTNSGGGHAFNKACGVNRVCETTGESGIGVHDPITLLVNPTLTIAPPP